MRPKLEALQLLLLFCCANAALSSRPTGQAGPVDHEVDVVIVGAGFAGLAAARHIRASTNSTVHVLEADDHVGGRVRNYDPVTGLHDTCTDTVVEIGGTFVSPSHTALIELAAGLGVAVYNVSGGGSFCKVQGVRRQATRNVAEPADAWPWWYWGVDTKGSLQTSVFHSFSGTHRFTTPKDVAAVLDNETWAELERAGKLMQLETNKIECNRASGDSWFGPDSITFEGWIQHAVAREESRIVLRAMCRGMIAQEAAQVSFLSIVKSMKGCWSLGDDDQYRLRGGSQCPLLRLQTELTKEGAITLSSAVSAVTQSDGAVIVDSAKLRLKATTVLLTGSPGVLSAIKHSPPLGHAQAQLLQRMPMGTSMKLFAFYNSAWCDCGACCCCCFITVGPVCKVA